MRIAAALFASLWCMALAHALTLEAAREFASGRVPVRVLLADGVEQVDVRATAGCLVAWVGDGIGRIGRSARVGLAGRSPDPASFCIEVDGLADAGAETALARALRGGLTDVSTLSLSSEGPSVTLTGGGDHDAAESALSQVGFLLPKCSVAWLTETAPASPSLRLALDDLPSTSGAEVGIGSPEGVLVGVSVRRAGAERPTSLGTYPGNIVVAVGARAGSLMVVDAAAVDDYVAGVVEREMPADAPLQALMAQAVAARSFALSRIDGDAGRPYDLESSTRAQSYTGLSGRHTPASEATMATAGVVLAYQGSVVPCYYHSTCGGTTDLPVHVFGGAAPGLVATRSEKTVGYGDLSEDANVRRLLRERPEASCSSSPLYRWERKCSGEQLDAAFRASGIGSNVGRAKQLEVTSRSPGGRVTGLRVMGTSGSVALDLQQVRSVLNHIPGDLPSTLFAIDVTRGAGGVVTGLHLWGGGSGHGAGMCQFCAMALARKGTTYDTILNRYYAGSRLVTLGGEPCR